MIWFWLWSWTWIWTRLWRWICIWYVVRCDEVMTTNVNVTMNMIKTCNDLMWWHYVWSLGDEVPTTLVGQPQCYTRSNSWLFQIVFCLETIVFKEIQYECEYGYEYEDEYEYEYENESEYAYAYDYDMSWFGMASCDVNLIWFRYEYAYEYQLHMVRYDMIWHDTDMNILWGRIRLRIRIRMWIWIWYDLM